MTSQQILQSDVLDILFEKRNKAYGAYLMRKTYHVQLTKAMSATALLVIALMFFGKLSSTKTEAVDRPNDGIVLIDVAVPQVKKIEPPKAKLQTPPPVKTEILTDKMRLVDKPKDPVATQRDLDNALPGSIKVDAPPASGIPAPSLPPSTGTGTTAKEPEKAEPPLPNRQPQFPGGALAWQKFLERNLTPPSDLEAGEKRSVLVRFSVDEEGVITNFQVVQSGGSDFDNEVIRVLKKMPRWLPAIQKGKAVAVSFTQPVTFQAGE